MDQLILMIPLAGIIVILLNLLPSGRGEEEKKEEGAEGRSEIDRFDRSIFDRFIKK